MTEFEKSVLNKLEAIDARFDSLENRFDSLEAKIDEEVSNLAASSQRQFDYLKKDLRAELAIHYEKLDSKLDGLNRRLDYVDDMVRSHSH